MCMQTGNACSLVKSVPPKGGCRVVLQLSVTHYMNVVNYSVKQYSFRSAKKMVFNLLSPQDHLDILQANICTVLRKVKRLRFIRKETISQCIWKFYSIRLNNAGVMAASGNRGLDANHSLE